MDHNPLIQRNLKKITIGLAIVGVASVTIWYMRNHGHKVEKEDVEELKLNLSVSKNINKSGERLIAMPVEQIMDNI